MAKNINVSIIVLDTLRFDTFSAITKSNPKLLERFRAISFNKCVSPASWTLPSHASLLTGLYPSQHGAHETKKIKSLEIDKIRLKKRTIMEELKQMGYSTYGISANPYIHPIYGFGGFDKFMEESYFTDISGNVIEISSRLKPMIAKYRNMYGNDIMKLSTSIIGEDPKLFFDLMISATALTPKAAMKKMKAKFIEGWPIEKGGKSILNKIDVLRMKQPFFLFVNFMEAHDPYIGKKGLDFNWATPFLKEKVDGKIVEKWQRLYKKASNTALRYGAELMNHLLDRFGDNQIIILTSDHGQAFDEHKFIGHGTVLFDEVVKVPLIVIVPKKFDKDVSTKGYQSLVNVREFVLAAIAGDRKALEKLSTKSVYAESFSIPANISNVKGIDSEKILKFDKYQKRIFK